MMRPKILVPFDFSASAEQALAWAADLQQTVQTGPLRLIHAINLGPIAAAAAATALLRPTSDDVARMEADMVAAAAKREAAATARVVTRVGSEAETILEIARNGGFDLIVMGTHGRTGVKRLVLGSIAEHVVRRAECPVVTVHDPSTIVPHRYVGPDYVIPEC